MTTPIWTPTTAIGNTKEIRPFVKLAEEARKLGFVTGINHDSKARTMQLRFLAETDRARAACRAAMDNPECDRLVVGAAYDASDNPIVVVAALWELGMAKLKEAL